MRRSSRSSISMVSLFRQMRHDHRQLACELDDPCIAERSKMTVDDLLEKFRENAGKNLDNDRILLSKVEK